MDMADGPAADMRERPAGGNAPAVRAGDPLAACLARVARHFDTPFAPAMLHS